MRSTASGRTEERSERGSHISEASASAPRLSRSTVARNWADASSSGVFSAASVSGRHSRSIRSRSLTQLAQPAVWRGDPEQPSSRDHAREAGISQAQSGLSTAVRAPSRRPSPGATGLEAAQPVASCHRDRRPGMGGARRRNRGATPALASSALVALYAPISRCWPLSRTWCAPSSSSTTRRARPPSSAAASSSTTRCPALESSAAAAHPAHPPPTTATRSRSVTRRPRFSTRARACAGASAQCAGAARGSPRARFRRAGSNRWRP